MSPLPSLQGTNNLELFSFATPLIHDLYDGMPTILWRQ